MSDVYFDPDSLIIETYRELMGVLLGLAVVTIALRFAWLSYRARKTSMARGAAAKADETKTALANVPVRAGEARQFTRLDSMISNIIERAENVSATQSQLALKLDTIEMAMHRMHNDVEGLVAVPRHMPPPVVTVASVTTAAAAPRTTRAA